ncbi:MAG: response regulator [Candidatus Kariarchaeaceae archaeon]|jgi:two-component system chemotaxis response regulator CheY
MAKILLCDDTRFMQLVTERLLKKMGHEILYKASDGEDVLDYYVQRWPEIDLIFLDVVMPKMDGLQVLRQILNINPRAKVIMVTAISNTSIVGGAMHIGASEFITKPFRLSEFVTAVNKVLSM